MFVGRLIVRPEGVLQVMVCCGLVEKLCILWMGGIVVVGVLVPVVDGEKSGGLCSGSTSGASCSACGWLPFRLQIGTHIPRVWRRKPASHVGKVRN